MYYDEDLILDIRLNALNKYVSKFIICEANFNHNGTKKKFNFDIKNFSEFSEKIIYLPLENQPKNLKDIEKSDNKLIKNSKILDNALKRENFQRNFLLNGIKEFNDEDLILISDLDEIPNLKNFVYKSKITLFEQKMYYYKLNLVYPNFIWYGSKVCKKKDLYNPQWLRNVKSKKYPSWRLDILFSKTKYNKIKIIKDGGWHFSNIKNPEMINLKMKNFLHHLEYEESGLKVNDLKRLIKERRVFYDHNLDKKEKKWKSFSKLEKEEDKNLPDYIFQNKKKFKDWIEI